MSFLVVNTERLAENLRYFLFSDQRKPLHTRHQVVLGPEFCYVCYNFLN